VFNDLDIVRLTEDVLCDEHITMLRMGEVGTIVAVYEARETTQRNAYIVEFANPRSSLVTVLQNQIVQADAPLKILVEIEKPYSHVWGARILFTVWPGEGPIVETARTVIDRWCNEQWDKPWERSNGQILVTNEAMAFDFKLRWHGVGIDGIFSV
jgi:hypothetical protein